MLYFERYLWHSVSFLDLLDLRQELAIKQLRLREALRELLDICAERYVCTYCEQHTQKISDTLNLLNMHRKNGKNMCSKQLLQPSSEASGDLSPKFSDFTWVGISAWKEGISGENRTGSNCICRANKDACIQEKMAVEWRNLGNNLRLKKMNCIDEQPPKSSGVLVQISIPSFVVISMQSFQLGKGINSPHLKLSVKVYTCDKKVRLVFLARPAKWLFLL